MREGGGQAPSRSPAIRKAIQEVVCLAHTYASKYCIFFFFGGYEHSRGPTIRKAGRQSTRLGVTHICMAVAHLHPKIAAVAKASVSHAFKALPLFMGLEDREL